VPVNSTIAAIRYGYGFAPNEAAPETVADIMGQLNNQRPLRVGPAFSTEASMDMLRSFLRTRQGAKNDPLKNAAKKKAKRKIGLLNMNVLQVRVGDALAPQAGFLERLVAFWADHFSVSAAKSIPARYLTGAFLEEAIRGNVTSSFPQMLKAVVLHPAMLDYLDQRNSVGPASPQGRKKSLGLNENLARELLELHTLGVDGTYTQKDVRQLSELLTGLTVQKAGFGFNKKFAEPGAERVLGQVYGGKRERLENILEFLDDVAAHPDTANHIARKLVVHFVSDTPDTAHVAHIADAFLKSKGDFKTVYQALLEHPNAWAPLGGKVKQPFDFVVSGLRAFGVTSHNVASVSPRNVRQLVAVPMALMGQRFMQPLGPDGWPEDAEHWITPQGLAGRIQWANLAVSKFGAGLDPRVFVRTTLEEFASPEVILAATRAEVRTEGLALVLASPEFNRR
jgi:uncharacterized protein (DUF1800 family)